MEKDADLRDTLARRCYSPDLQRTIFPDGVIGDCKFGQQNSPDPGYKSIIFSKAVNLEQNLDRFPYAAKFEYINVLQKMNGFRFFRGQMFGFGFRPPPDTIKSPFAIFSIVTANLEHPEIVEKYDCLVIGGTWLENPERLLAYVERRGGEYQIIDTETSDVIEQFSSLTDLLFSEYARHEK